MSLVHLIFLLLCTGKALSRTPQQQQRYTQIISDMDDTLKSSGGVAVAGVALGGIDVQYSRGTVYPGVAEFMLQACSSGSDVVPPPCVAILTARAHEFRALLQLKQDSPVARQLSAAAQKEGIQGWGIGPVLYGSVAEWVLQDRKGLRKFANFERLLLHPAMDYIFVGDTGELDQQAGEAMLRKYPDVVKAVFLHVVFGEQVVGRDWTLPAPKWINGRPVIFFRTYVGAAVSAVHLGLMSTEGLESVIHAVRLQCIDMPKDSDKWLDIEEDIQRAHELLALN